MAKLCHLALQVPDLEKSACFYEQAFDLKRVREAESPIGNAIMLSDGTVNLTLLHVQPGTWVTDLTDGYPGVDAEIRCKDNHGIVLDISEHDWTQADEI